MSLLEINIEKPALVEERVYPNEDTAPASARTQSESSSDRSVLSLVKPLVGLLLVAGLTMLVRKFRAGDDDSAAFESDEFDSDFDSGSNHGQVIAGVVGLLSVVALVRKVRGGSADE